MPTRFVEVWLGGNNYLPVPRAYPNEPFRLYANRVRGFFAKHAPAYPSLAQDLLRAAYSESQFFHKMSTRMKPWQGPNLRSTQMTLAQRQRLVQRKQKLAGFRVTQFQHIGRKGVADRETGYVDTAVTNYVFDTTGAIALIPTIAQGASTNQRIGKKAFIKSIQCRGSFLSGTTATINDVALLVVYDKRPTGALPAITDILVSANSRSFNNDTNSGRFRILKRIDATLSGDQNLSTGVSPAMNADFFLKVNKPIVFKAAGTGGIGDIEEGAIYVVTVGNVAAGTAAALCTLGFRTRFQDF